MSGKIGNNTGYSSGSVTTPSAGVEIRSDDPTLSEGLMWYNTTANTLKVARNITAFSSGGALNVAGQNIVGFGTKTAALAGTGYGPGNNQTGRDVECEEYNGTGWTAVNSMTEAKINSGSAGTAQTAGILFGGSNNGGRANRSDESFEYDGTSWAAAGDLNTADVELGGCGSQTAALRVGGDNNSSFSTVTEEYDGSSWANKNSLSRARSNNMTCGTTTAGLTTGGNPVTDTTEEFNGTAWSSGGALSTARTQCYSHGGIQTDAIMAGGANSSNAALSASELYDGSSWASGASITRARQNSMFCGMSAASAGGLQFGGATGDSATTYTDTDEYTASLTARSVTAS